MAVLLGHGLVTWAGCGQEGFDELGLHRVELRSATGNAAPLAVARKAGFLVEGVQGDAWRVRDQVQSVVMHSRLEDDPAPG